jgi:molybdate transport system permease protein
MWSFRERTVTQEAELSKPKANRFRIILSVLLFLYVSFILSLLLADLLYVDFGTFLSVSVSREILFALKLSLISATITALLSVVIAIPAGYALSRYRFPGQLVIDTLVDMPIVLPPLVVGISLLVFFRTPLGQLIERTGISFVYSARGVVLAQFTVASAFAVRTIKGTFDTISPRQEQVARTLGCSRFQAFRRVALPQARNGIVAGGILAWARAIGEFGPVMVLCGATRLKTEVLPTSIYLELSKGVQRIRLYALTFGHLTPVCRPPLCATGKPIDPGSR